MRITIILSMFALLSSCAFHNGNFSSSTAITNNNFRIAGNARAQSSTLHFMGLGGLKKDALVNDARIKLNNSVPLARGMAFGNASVDFKRTFILMFMKTTVTINADVIDFNPASGNINMKGFYTDDSTYFYLPKVASNPSVYTESEVINVKPGTIVSFFSGEDNRLIKATVIENNSYGIKCEYDSASGKKKIYLKPYQVSIGDWK